MRILISILILFSSINSFSQELKVSLDKNPALTNEVIKLQFIINKKSNDFIPPSLSNFHILNGPSQGFSQSYSNINGKTAKEIKTTISYNIQAKKEGKYIIGPASVQVNNKTIKSKSIEIVVEKSTNKEIKNTNNEEQVFIKLQINKSEVFVGEQISAVSKIYIKNGVNIQNTEVLPITYNGFWEDEVKVTNKQQREIIDGIAYTVIKFRHSILTTQKNGDIIIPSSEMNISISARGRLISNHPFFGPQYETVIRSDHLTSNPRKIKVKELPKPKPKNFDGTVSEKFTINTSVDKTNLTTSEAISFKLTFRGEGNIKMLYPSFETKFPSSFEVFEPTISDNTYVGNKNTGGSKTFEYILIPREEGNFTIPEIKFSYFNPKTELYTEINTKEHLISVKKDAENNQTDEVGIDSDKSEEEYTASDTTQSSIKDLYPLENSESSSIWYSFSYWMIFAIIIISYLVYFILSKRSVNPIDMKRRKSTQIAIKRLKNARFCLKNDNFDLFFEEIEKSLWGYFAYKFEVNSSELSKETIDLYFNKKNIKTETKSNFISLLNICEFARYSPSKDRNQRMEKTLENAKEIIIKVESDMKNK